MAGLRAEWTKLRTETGTAWLLLALVGATVGLGAVVAAAVTCPAAGCGQDPARVGLSGIQAGQAVVVILAVVAIGGEYGTGMIRTTLTAVPRRGSVLVGKAVVVGGLVLVAGTVAVVASVLVGQLILPGNGFTAEHGYPSLALTDGSMARAALGSVGYLVLVGWLSLGVATVVRDSAAAIGVVLGLLYLFPIVAPLVADPDWHRRLQQLAPMTAGLAVQATVDVGRQLVPPAEGIGVLAVWAAGALLAGWLVLRARDA